MFAQFLFQDIADPASYQTGLLFPDGRSKPALQAFKLPFWAQAQEANGQSYVLIWGQVRPDSGAQNVALELQQADGTWHTVPSFQLTLVAANAWAATTAATRATTAPRAMNLRMRPGYPETSALNDGSSRNETRSSSDSIHSRIFGSFSSARRSHSTASSLLPS